MPAREEAAKPFTGSKPGCEIEDAFLSRKLKEKEGSGRESIRMTLAGDGQAKEMVVNFKHRRS